MSWDRWRTLSRAYNRICGIAIMAFGLFMVVAQGLFLGTIPIGLLVFWIIVIGTGVVVYATAGKKE